MERHLAAVLADDVVGYSRLMNEDETGTLNALRLHRSELIQPRIAGHGGRIVKLLGDGPGRSTTGSCFSAITAKVSRNMATSRS